MPERLVVFGIGGDLAGRYLLPALAELEGEDRLPERLAIVGTGRDPWDDARLREYARQRLAEHKADVPPRVARRLLERLRYRRGDAGEAADVAAAVAGEGPAVAYLALPPSLFEPAVEALGRAGDGVVSTVVVEKPFGSDLASAQSLNAVIHRHFDERDVLRVDHFLHLQTVQSVLSLRFANRLFEPLWDARHVAAVEITWDETLALESRAGYYDDAGALRDVVQNHLLQLFCLVAMEPPASLDGDELRRRKVEVLRAVGEMSDAEVARRTVRGRYGAGTIDGHAVPAYTDEEGVDPQRATETFAQVTLEVENRRWAGVPFTLRTGKALGADRHEIRVRFRPVPDPVFGDGGEATPNSLRLGIEPDTVELELMVSGATAPHHLEPATMELPLGAQTLSAYARLLLDALEGDTRLGIGAQEAEEAWRVFEPVLAAWQRGTPPLHEYAAGTSGPAAAGER